MKKEKRKIFNNWIFIAVSLLFVLIVGVGYAFYSRVFEPNTKGINDKGVFVYIPTGATFTDVHNILQSYLIDAESFDWTAGLMKYDKIVKPGRYLIEEGMSNRAIVSLLRSGRQMPVRLTFNNVRTVEQLAGRISQQIEADSTSIVALFRDSILQSQNGFTVENCISIIIPNTYEFYWNTSASGFYKRMLKEYNIFWDSTRKQKAEAIGLTQEQVSVIASIVEQETQQVTEKKMIAGVYINRFRKNWKLEADPTLVFALGDFTVRRVLNEYKLIDSPYNTYKYFGLPPGPICIPGISSLDAVLNAANHQYMYFCAKDDFSGFHAFAETYNEHLMNARKFQRALTLRGILQ